MGKEKGVFIDITVGKWERNSNGQIVELKEEKSIRIGSPTEEQLDKLEKYFFKDGGRKK